MPDRRGCCKDDCRIEITGWEQVTGDWTPTLGGWITEDSDALLVATNEHPAEKSRHVVIASLLGLHDGDVLRLVVAYRDSDNYLFGEVEFDSAGGYVRLFRVANGSMSQISQTLEVADLPSGFGRRFQVCYDGSVLIARISTSDAIKSLHTAVTFSGTRVGIATGGIHQTAAFTSIRWYDHYSDGGYYEEPNNCPRCEHPLVCEYCSGPVPMYYAVTISGIEDQGCDNCEAFDGTYILPNIPTTNPLCQWQQFFSGISHTCGDRIIVSLIHSEHPFPAANYQTVITFRLMDGAWSIANDKVIIQWRLLGNGLINCDSVNTPIPFWRQELFLIGGIGALYCDGFNATCVIEAL
jgi:hypothetical protein